MKTSPTEPVSNGFETLSQRAYRELKQQILDGRLKPGERLVRRVLSKRLGGVSPVPVSHAIKELERDGLVESAPMHGARVVSLTADRVRNDQIMREALECQAARLCAQRADSQALKHLRQIAVPLDRAMIEADPQDRAGMQQHMEFHLAVAEASGAPILVENLTRIWFCRLMQLAWVNASLERVPKYWHQDLVRALSSGDPDVAETVMRKHVLYGKQNYLEAIQQAVQRESQ